MRTRAWISGWRGAALVAATYIYFLIFAEFGFLARLSELGLGALSLKGTMAAMAAGGIALSLLMPRLTTRFSSAIQLRFGFALCGAAAGITITPLGFGGAGLVAFCIGAGLGIVTVSLVTHLREWTGTGHPILAIGAGTGLAYFVCNIPSLFKASPGHQAIFATFMCAAGILLTFSSPDLPAEFSADVSARFSFPRALVSFAALVWLDSAAFFIIQHTPSLKAGTWMGNPHLWTNGCIHLVAAIGAAILLGARRPALVLSCAVVALGFACMLLLRPTLVLPASLFYPAGVSLYSVALIAYPSFLSSARTTRERAQQAGWIYAVAGWMGSALGIGMGQNLGYVPPIFVGVAILIVLTPWLIHVIRIRAREVMAVCAALTFGFLLFRLLPTAAFPSTASAAERGRQVYISEGCISCHSQYVRPGTADELMWGPTQTMRQVHAQKPPLIGNRRQGPDLAQVGLRRSPFWLKAHLIAPADLSARSIMPSYAFLFADGRGYDLVAYLTSLHGTNDRDQLQLENAWEPSVTALHEASRRDGEQLYGQECATCHEGNGAARQQWPAHFKKLPEDQASLSAASDRYSFRHLAQIVKFGISGTDMPGHEYLSDQQITSLTLWLTRRSAPMFPHS
ncbi:MAG TPA: cbb3-type cytochrome c oxidase subunit II [Terracidiphilus sp.]|nr:cbb3-type cytochrome c oxidase subunit II [Terracidiphilus sp.]